MKWFNFLLYAVLFSACITSSDQEEVVVTDEYDGEEGVQPAVKRKALARQVSGIEGDYEDAEAVSDYGDDDYEEGVEFDAVEVAGERNLEDLGYGVGGGLGGAGHIPRPIRKGAPAASNAPADAMADIQAISEDLTGNVSDLQTPEQIAAQALMGKRKIHYNASVTYKHKEPRKAITTLVDYSQKYGAKIRHQTLNSVELDVPVNHFFTVYNYVLKQGDVVNKLLSARDVTNAYTDLEGRRDVLQTSKAKFEELMKTAANTQQRLSLLKQIQRLNEQITRIDQALAKLKDMASYSVIAVTAKPRSNAFVNFRPTLPKGFAWLADLGPYDDSLAQASLEIVNWEAPKNFIEVNKDNYYYAESPSKSFLRVSRLQNEPKGDTDFWVKALTFAVQKRPTATIKVEKVAGFQVAVISDEHFKDSFYSVAVRAEDDQLIIAESVFPTQKDKKRFYDNVVQTFKQYDGGGVYAH